MLATTASTLEACLYPTTLSSTSFSRHDTSKATCQAGMPALLRSSKPRRVKLMYLLISRMSFSSILLSLMIRSSTAVCHARCSLLL